MKVKVSMDEHDEGYEGPKVLVFDEVLDYDDPEYTVGNLFQRLAQCMGLDCGEIALHMLDYDRQAIASFGYEMGVRWSDRQKQLFREAFNPSYVEGENAAQEFADRQEQIIAELEAKKKSDLDRFGNQDNANQ